MQQKIHARNLSAGINASKIIFCKLKKNSETYDSDGQSSERSSQHTYNLQHMKASHHKSNMDGSNFWKETAEATEGELSRTASCFHFTENGSKKLWTDWSLMKEKSTYALNLQFGPANLSSKNSNQLQELPGKIYTLKPFFWQTMNRKHDPMGR